MGYELFARDTSLERVAQIDDFTTAEFILRFNRPGSWRIEGVPADGTVAGHLAVGAGVVVVRDETTLLSGPLTLPSRRFAAGENHRTVEGVDDLVHLWDRIAHPSPSDGNFATQAYDVRTGICSTIIRQYVDVNAAASALSTRRVTGLTLAADPLLGSSVSGRARLDNLGDFLADLAVRGGDLGFKIVQSGSGIVFSVYAPEDKTATVIFSTEFGNVTEFTYDDRAPETSYVYVGGGGEGTARTVIEGGDSTAISRWGRRIEKFVDQRQTTDTTELTQARTEELAIGAEQVSLVLEPIDTAAMTFGTDYELGDQVTAVIDGVAVELVVREVRITLTGDGGETIVPVLATPQAPTPELALFSRLRRLDTRVRNIERR